MRFPAFVVLIPEVGCAACASRRSRRPGLLRTPRAAVSGTAPFPIGVGSCNASQLAVYLPLHHFEGGSRDFLPAFAVLPVLVCGPHGAGVLPLAGPAAVAVVPAPTARR